MENTDDPRPLKCRQKDSQVVRCISRVTDPCGAGHRYTFSHRKDSHNFAQWPAGEPIVAPSSRRLEQLGYRWWSDDAYYYAEVPCPTAFNKRSGHCYSWYKCTGIQGDLQFAVARATHDHVVSTTAEFYHDMVVHVPYDVTRPSLRRWINAYKALSGPPNPYFEFCLGLFSDMAIDLNLATLTVLFAYEPSGLIERRFGRLVPWSSRQHMVMLIGWSAYIIMLQLTQSWHPNEQERLLPPQLAFAALLHHKNYDRVNSVQDAQYFAEWINELAQHYPPGLPPTQLDDNFGYIDWESYVDMLKDETAVYKLYL